MVVVGAAAAVAAVVVAVAVAVTDAVAAVVVAVAADRLGRQHPHSKRKQSSKEALAQKYSCRRHQPQEPLNNEP